MRNLNVKSSSLLSKEELRKRRIWTLRVLISILVVFFLFLIYVFFFIFGRKEEPQNAFNPPTSSSENIAKILEEKKITPSPFDVSEEYIFETKEEAEERLVQNERNFIVINGEGLDYNSTLGQGSELFFYNSTNKSVQVAFSNGNVINISPGEEESIVLEGVGIFYFEEISTRSNKIRGEINVK